MPNNDTLVIMDRLEDCATISYKCSEGKVTIGYGNNMDSKGARDRWLNLDIMEDFDDVYDGLEKLTHFSATILFEHYWDYCITKVIHRCAELDVYYGSLPEWHKFILADIVYNTGSISKWSKVLRYKEPRKVLFEARRKDDDGGHSLDSRVAKIGYFYGIISDLEDAHSLGLDEAKYIL